MRVSVLCCVRNGARYLPEALAGVFAQTFQDFELILVDDGSTDETAALVDRAARDDARVVAIHHAHQGLTRSLNVGLCAARGDYVARQDADDVSLPHRLERQVAFLDGHPEHLIVGCRYRKIDAEGRWLGGANTPRNDLPIKLRLLDSNCIAHSGATFRRSGVLEAGAYDEAFEVAQDYELWCRLALRGKLANIPVVALYRRQHGEAINATRAALQLRMRDEIRRRYRDALLANPPSGLGGWLLASAAARRRGR